MYLNKYYLKKKNESTWKVFGLISGKPSKKYYKGFRNVVVSSIGKREKKLKHCTCVCGQVKYVLADWWWPRPTSNICWCRPRSWPSTTWPTSGAGPFARRTGPIRRLNSRFGSMSWITDGPSTGDPWQRTRSTGPGPTPTAIAQWQTTTAAANPTVEWLLNFSNSKFSVLTTSIRENQKKTLSAQSTRKTRCRCLTYGISLEKLFRPQYIIKLLRLG